MAKFNLIGITAVVFFLTAFTISDSMMWTIDDKHSIKFSGEKVSGYFETFSGDIQFNQNNLQDSRFDVQLEVSSIKTGNFLKNRHAKGKSWFDAEQFPTINFISKKIEKLSSGYQVEGTLDMHGIEKEITIPFSFDNQIFTGSFTVNRTDFNIGATTGMSKKVGHDITLDIAVPVTK